MNKKKEKNNDSPHSLVAMLGVRQQRCPNGNIMEAHTTMNSAAGEELACLHFPKVVDIDIDQTTQIDRRILGEMEWSRLCEKVQATVRANTQLDLSSDLNLSDVIQKLNLLRDLTTNKRPQLAEELGMSIKSACEEAGKNVRSQFDLAAARAPSRVDAVIKYLADANAKMDRTKSSDGHALARFEKRANQFRNLPRQKDQIKEATYDKLISHLAQKAQSEYLDVLKQWTEDQFWEHWKNEREMIRERFEEFMADRRDFYSKIRICIDELNERVNRARERLTTLKAGNQIVLEEASVDEFLATLMANRKVGGQSELIRELRHDFEERLRRRAEQRALGQQYAQQMPFCSLVVALSQADVVDTFIMLILEGTSDSHSFFESCEKYGLERLVLELTRRSRITSFFDGRNDSRFGITHCEVLMVRMPKATNPREVEIKELLKALFAKEGFHEILNNSYARSISVLRIYAGWPIGIEGSNPALLEVYKDSKGISHLPHLVGILPDTKAGEHAPGIMRL